MIVITGAWGFIGSAVVSALNDMGNGFDLIVVDDFYQDYKEDNLKGKVIREWIHRDIFLPWFRKSHASITAVIHLGARTDTAEQDTAIFDVLNVAYSKEIWNICTQYAIPLIYASSAATYGDGTHGFVDDDEVTRTQLHALNPYGESKLAFDKWVLQQDHTPPHWYGLRFFNVFGANEYHKGRMASVVFHAFKQIHQTGKMKLFRSHRPDVEDGHQSRDFIYIKDVVTVILQLLKLQPPSGIYNLGTGKARTFLDLVQAIFQAMDQSADIEFIDTPEDIRAAYQYYTQADMSKWESTPVDVSFDSLEASVEDYVTQYLAKGYLRL